MRPNPLPDPVPEDLLRRLSTRRPAAWRYHLEGEVARGGMGSILKVWDEDLRRHLAMKVVLGREEDAGSSASSGVNEKQLARFLEEAQVTGQLDHPGIVPVHELGVDADGRVFFTMKLVRGQDLRQVFDLVFASTEGWTETRALGVLQKVCEATAYAHAKGVIHRDLKPANVMVGAFGEVYVMDWGLSRVLGRDDKHDIRIRPEAALTTKSVRTERRDAREDAPDSPLVTMDGDVMGTPAYMAPEQARGEIEELSPRTDVYAIGAMLYHLLARQCPYVPRGAKVSARTTLMRVLEGPPVPLATLAERAAPELVAICEKAMARAPADRYPDTLALAADLRAYLEGRVVAAYETGAWAETRKWARRNRGLAGATAIAVLLLVGGLATSLLFRARAEASAQLATHKALIATEQTRRAEAVSAELLGMTHGFIPRVVGEDGLRIRPRSAWGAVEPVVERMRPMDKITRLTIHHEGGDDETPSELDGAVRILAIQASHMASERNWGDIGFHYVIDASGSIFEGRSLAYQGAHVGAADNVANIGIELLGTFEQADPTPQQLVSVVLLVQQLRKDHGIGNEGVLFHNDLRTTQCPGKRARDLLLRLGIRDE